MNHMKKVVAKKISDTMMNCLRMLSNATPEDGPVLKDVSSAALLAVQLEMERCKIKLTKDDLEIFKFLMKTNQGLAEGHYDILPVKSLYVNYLRRVSEITDRESLTSLAKLLTKVTPDNSDMVIGILKAALAGINIYDLHEDEQIIYNYLEKVQRTLLSGDSDILPCNIDGISLAKSFQESPIHGGSWRDLYKVVLLANELPAMRSKGYKIKTKGMIIKVIHEDIEIAYIDFESIRSDDGKSYEPYAVRIFPYKCIDTDSSGVNGHAIIIDIDDNIQASISKLEDIWEEAGTLIDVLEEFIKRYN